MVQFYMSQPMQIYARFNQLARPLNPIALDMIRTLNQKTSYVLDQHWQTEASKLW